MIFFFSFFEEMNECELVVIKSLDLKKGKNLAVD